MPSLQIQKRTILNTIKVLQEICGVTKFQIEQTPVSLLHTHTSSMTCPFRPQCVSVSQVSCQKYQLVIIENNEIAPIAINCSFAAIFNRNRLVSFRNLKIPQCFPHIANRAVGQLLVRGTMYMCMYIIIKAYIFTICMLLKHQQT